MALGDAYRIEKELGGGGMSRVFLAEDTSLGRKVVIKVLPPEMAAGVNVERFRREIKLAASLQHPHIVPLLSAGSSGDLLYYVMPFIPGESLRGKLAREGELPIPQAVRILCDVVDALAYAHRNGVVHRDIKPDNVLISGQHAVVTDFGVAKAVSEATGASSLTSIGVALGTPAYMAPEQAAADPHTDHRADIYAVGAVAYELLAGRPPFTGMSPQMMLAAHVTEAPSPVTSHRVMAPALGELVMRCLAKKPADRWQTADELLHQLEAMATPSGGMTPTASIPVTRTNRRLVPRPRTLAWTAAAIVVLGAAFGAVSWYRHRASTLAGSLGKKLVVLPFQNLGAPDDQYFADGITEEITERLASLNGIGVISRTSAIQYRNTTKSLRQIGSELGVQYVLEGTIRWEHAPGGPSLVRVTPQLIRVSDDTHLWASTYDDSLTHVFQVQSEIAGRVAQALNTALLDSAGGAEHAKPTSNLQAYDYFLRATSLLERSINGDDYLHAAEMYQRAIALDTNFALAWARLSRAHTGAYWFYGDRTDQRLAKAKGAVDRALALQPDLAEGHVALGYYDYWGSLDYTRALEEFGIARRREPNNTALLAGIAFVERRQGRYEDAAAVLQRAVELDPRNGNDVQSLSETYTLLRRYDDAARLSDQAIAVGPDLAYPYVLRATIAILASGDSVKARQVMRDASSAIGPGRLAAAIANQYADYGSAIYFLDADAAAALDRLSLAGDITDSSSFYLCKADLFKFRHRAEAARAYADSARLMLDARVRGRADDPQFHQQLGHVYAALARKADAIREARRATELLPVSKDALGGVNMIESLAEVYATVGDQDAAIERLQYLLSVPSNVSVHALRGDPVFAPLRSNPRFQKLVSSARGTP
jgi:TolB-like protein